MTSSLSLLANSTDDIGSLRRNREHTTEMAAAVDNFDVEEVDDDDGFFVEKWCLVACSAGRRAAAEVELDISLDEIIIVHYRTYCSYQRMMCFYHVSTSLCWMVR